MYLELCSPTLLAHFFLESFPNAIQTDCKPNPKQPTIAQLVNTFQNATSSLSSAQIKWI